jgi:cytochrome c
MRKCLQRWVWVALLGLQSSAFAAGNKGTADEAVAMVHKVINQMKTNGIEKTLSVLNRKKTPEELAAHKGEFLDRDLYIVVYDMHGKNLAHLNPKMVGKDLSHITDADGKPFMKERIELVTSKGKGWQDYKFVNPVSKAIEQKSMYVERYQDVIIGCGVYK